MAFSLRLNGLFLYWMFAGSQRFQVCTLEKECLLFLLILSFLPVFHTHQLQNITVTLEQCEWWTKTLKCWKIEISFDMLCLGDSFNCCLYCFCHISHFWSSKAFVHLGRWHSCNICLNFNRIICNSEIFWFLWGKITWSTSTQKRNFLIRVHESRIKRKFKVIVLRTI